MSDQPRHVPTKSTSGAGFAFEDEVVAFLAACLLARVEPWSGGGVLLRIQCQTKHLGWRPDDLLLDVETADRVRRRCAGSIKQMPPVGASGFSPRTEFAQDAQALWSGQCEVAPPFDAEQDRVVLIGRGSAQTVWTDWLVVAGTIQGATEEQLERGELSLSVAQRRLFEGLAPADQRLSLRCVQVVDMTHVRLTRDICRDLMTAPTDEAASRLEQELLAFVQSVRHRAGSLDLPVLVRELRSAHSLAAYADHRGDWAALRAIGARLLAEIPTDLDGHELPRDAELAEIEKAFSRSDVRAVALVGESGCGKTVVAKRWLEQLAGPHDLWWDNATLEADGPTALRNSLALTHGLADLFGAVPVDQACLVHRDGIDRLSGRACWENIGRVLSALDLASASTAWRLVVTCEAEAWEEIRHQLEAVGLPRGRCGLVAVTSPDLRALAPVLAGRPGLRALLDRPHLSGLLSRPKVLALVLPRLDDELGNLANESALIDWIWRAHVELQLPERGRAAQVLGQRQADRMSPRVPVTELESADLPALEALRGDGICRYRGGTYSFSHDLYGDWARLHFLQHSACPKTASMLWQRALRLLGVAKLEQEGAAAWQRVLIEAASRADAAEVEGRLLESLGLASTAEARVAELWPALTSHDGRLLRRWLALFAQVGTEAVTPLGADFRRPRWHLWPPVLRALLDHWEDVSRLAPAEFAQLAVTWLTPLFGEQELSREVAEAALELAERTASDPATSHWRSDHGPLRAIYTAALRAAPWWPDRAAQFALDRAGRRGEPDLSPFHEPVTHRVLPAVEPWPDGPCRQVDEGFRDVCLETVELAGLIRHRPAEAQEVLLALFIEWRRPDHMLERWLFAEDRTRLTECHSLVHFHDRGPFWLVLQLSPAEGIACLLRLVNFATERYADTSHGTLTVSIEPWGVWAGDARVFTWYRDHPHAPDSVSIGLMALEKWLYDLAEQQGVAALEPWLVRLIAGSRSVAVAGLLAAVAVRHPELLRGVLRPLLTKREFVWWDVERALLSVNEPHAWPSELDYETFCEWHRLPHRGHSLLDVVLSSRMLFGPEEKEFFAGVRERWAAELGGCLEPDGLTPQFDPDNYSLRAAGELRFELIYTAPAKVQAYAAARQREAQPFRLWSHLTVHCRQLLDGGRPDWWIRALDPWAEPEMPAGALSAEEAEGLWHQGQQMAAIADDAELAAHLRPPFLAADALCGVAATLLVRAREWLAQDEERVAWCIDTLVAVVLQQPNRGAESATWEHPTVLADTFWCGLAAEALPMLLAERPDDPQVRRAVALLATDCHYSTVARLLAAVGKVRGALGDDFAFLQRVALEYALIAREDHAAAQAWQARWAWIEQPFELRERYARVKRWWRRLRLRLDWYRGLLPTRPLSGWRQREVDAFAGPRCSTVVPRLAAMARWEEEPDAAPTPYGHRNWASDPGLDMEILRAALAWLGPPDTASDETERADWVSWWHEIAAFQGQRLGGGEPWDGPGPIDWDDWVRAALAQVTVRMRSDERPELLWQPLLRSAASAPHGVAHFVHSIFQAGLQDAERARRMVSQWQAMIDFALDERVLDRAWDVQAALIGCGQPGLAPWQPEHEPLLAEMRGHLARFAAEYARSGFVWDALVRFLRLPAAASVRLAGLCWLAAARSVEAEPLPARSADNLAKLLTEVRTTQAGQVGTYPDAASAFEALVAALGDHPRAVELR